MIRLSSKNEYPANVCGLVGPLVTCDIAWPVQCKLTEAEEARYGKARAPF
jgi:hypothetical protein